MLTANFRKSCDKPYVRMRLWNSASNTYRVQGTGESQGSGDTAHDDGDQVVQVTESGLVDLQGLHANVVQGFVVDTESLVRVFDKLVDREGGVVRLNNGVGDLIEGKGISADQVCRLSEAHLGGRNNGESSHHSVWEFLSNLGDQERTHTGTGTTTERVGDLETLEAVDSFGFLSDNVENRVDEFGTFGVMTLGPVVTGSGLTKDAVVSCQCGSVIHPSNANSQVVGPEQAAQRTSLDAVHGSGFQIDQDCSRDILLSSGFVEVDVDSFQLRVGSTLVATIGLDTVFFGQDLPELGTDLVTTLTSLKVDDFSHL